MKLHVQNCGCGDKEGTPDDPDCVKLNADAVVLTKAEWVCIQTAMYAANKVDCSESITGDPKDDCEECSECTARKTSHAALMIRGAAA